MGISLSIDGPKSGGPAKNILRRSVGKLPILLNNDEGTAVLFAEFPEPKDIVSLSLDTRFANFVEVKMFDSGDMELQRFQTVRITQ